MCVGEPHFVDYGKQFRSGTQAFQWLLQKLTGWGALCYQTHMKVKSQLKVKAKSDLEDGFSHIRNEGPRSNIHNRQTEWTEIEIHRQDSPIFGWSAGLVKESLKGYASTNVFAEPVTDFYLTLHDLREWFLHDCLYPLLPVLKEKTLVLMGLAEKGKTPVAQALAMAMSEYWLLVDEKDQEIQPSFRLAASLDQLRGDPGLKYRPDILDDADTSTIPIAKMKSFLDSSITEAFTDNKVNEEAETTIAPGQTNIPFKQFLEMIQPAFPGQATKQDAMACLKRAHWIVNLNHAVYVRPAGVNEDPVPLVTFPPDESDFISDEGKKVLGAMRQGISISQDTWLEKRQWSHDLVSMLLEGKRPPPRAPTIRGPSLFDKKKRTVEEKAELPFSGRLCSFFVSEPAPPSHLQAPSFAEAAPESPPPSPLPSPPPAPSSSRPASTLAPKDASAPVTLTAVKQEINNDTASLADATFMFPNLVGKGIADVIDLDSPSPQPKRARTGADVAEDIGLAPASDLQANIEEEEGMDHQFPEIGAADDDES
eukprot:Skav230348  [mRNA]  locus=scaffold25:300997:302825:- [translate_table: standard]